MEVKNAVIIGTNLGVQHTDHGILSFYIHLDYGGGGQGFGGWVLDTVNSECLCGNGDVPIRIPTELGSGLLLGIDKVFGCDWEKLKGVSCRAYGDGGKVTAIGHYLRDTWMWLREIDDDNYEFVVSRFEDIG